MKESLSILPLDDGPVSGTVVRAPHDNGKTLAAFTGYWEAHDKGTLQLSDWLREVSAGADTSGFFPLTLGELVVKTSSLFNESPDYLRDNLWVLRRHLEDAGYLSAPDMEMERRRLKDSDTVMLYASNDFSRIIRSRGYKKGLLFIKFATLILSPLNERELEECDHMLGQWVGKERYRRHLQALLRWYNRRRRLLDIRTKRSFFEIMDDTDKEKMTSQLLSLTSRRGLTLSGRALEQLDRLLVLAGCSPGEVHALLHRQSLGEKRRPLQVYPSGENKSDSPGLDPLLVKKIEASTRRVQELLAPVMSNESLTMAVVENPCPAVAKNVETFPVLVHLLSRQDEWRLEELRQELAKVIPGDLGSLIAQLETLNDRAYDLTDEAAVEIEGQTVYANHEVLTQIQNEIKKNE